MKREKFIQLIEQEQKGLMKFLLALCGGNYDNAEDLAQETALKAYLSYSGFVERFKFTTWLYRIAYNSFIDFQRKNKVSMVTLESAMTLANESEKHNFQYEELYKAIEELPADEKTALLLFYMEDMKVLEIALVMQKPIGTIKSYLNRGRKQLKIKLTHE